MTEGAAFLVTGALGCIGAWTVRELVRSEGVSAIVKSPAVHLIARETRADTND